MRAVFPQISSLSPNYGPTKFIDIPTVVPSYSTSHGIVVAIFSKNLKITPNIDDTPQPCFSGDSFNIQKKKALI
jgi:hypothetical protein